MFSKVKIATIAIVALFASVFSAVNAEVYSGIRSSGLESAFRNEAGVQKFPTPQEAVNVMQNIANKLDNSTPSAVWIVGLINGSTCNLEFPNPGVTGSTSNITFAGYDKHEDYMQKFDDIGAKVFLQVEAGMADMNTLIDAVVKQYGHHSSFAGFGIDVEWFPSSGITNGIQGGINRKMTNTEVKNYSDRIKNAKDRNGKSDPNRRLYVKHWIPEYCGTSAQSDVIYIDDSQDFNWAGSGNELDEMADEFSGWANTFKPNDVGFQIGYPDDLNWWSSYTDPIKRISDAIKAKIKNQNVHIYWVDFTIRNSKFNSLWNQVKFTATVNGGTGSGDYDEGNTVSIKATIPSGKEFVNWTSSDISIPNATSTQTSFKMPKKNVTVTANYKVTNLNLIDKNDLAFWEWEIPKDKNGNDIDDGYGSKAIISKNDRQNGIVEYSFNIAAGNEAKNIYPWTNIATYFNEGDFKNVTKIDIEYTATKNVNLVLVDGHEEGEAYYYPLSASATKKLLSINISQFIQPEWAKDENMTYTLDKSKVVGVSIDGIYIDGSAQSLSGSLTKCLLTGLVITIPTHTVTFNSNGGNPIAKIENIEEGKTINNPDNPTRKGYDFANWYSNSTLTELFDFNTAITEDITLYAKWTPKTYNITYNLNDGINNAENPESYTIETPNIMLKDPAKTDFYFSGWYNNKDFHGLKITSIAKGNTGDTTLFAKWSSNVVTKYKLTIEDYEFEYEENDIVELKASDYMTPSMSLCGGTEFFRWEFNTEVEFVEETNEESENVMFIMPAKDVVVEMITQTYTIESVLTFSVIDENGAITAVDKDGNAINSSDNAVCGDLYTFTAIPDNGYKVKEWTYNGEIVPNNKTNTCEIEIYGEIPEVTVKFEKDNSVPIVDTPKPNKIYGIKIKQNPASVQAEIGVILPDNEKFADTKIVIYDMTGNIVFNAKSQNGKFVWDLRNNAGRNVANGTYLVIFESKSVNGNAYRYSAKLGVKR